MSNKHREVFAAAQSLMRSGDAVAAKAAAEKGLLDYPQDGNLLCLAARASMATKQLVDARRYVDEVIGCYPNFASAQDVCGDLLLVEGRPEEALQAYKEALRLQPQRPAVTEKMARAEMLLNAGPSRFADRLHEADDHEKNDRRDKAETIYRDILKRDPDHVEASRRLAGIAAGHDQYREAVVFLKRAIELAPDYARAWVDLANVQRKLEDYEDAIESAQKVIELTPEKAEAQLLYASILGAADRHEEAIAVYEKVLEMSPDKASAMCGMAHHLKTIGRQDDAIARYRESIATRSDHAESYWSLANLKTFRFEDAEVQAMHDLLESKTLDDRGRAQVHNALGLEYESRKDFDRAFENFEKCNLLQRPLESYDPVDMETTNDRIIELFDEAFLAESGGSAVNPTPIFVVGLPRSGSTLIEQILASHSSVEGTHELADLSRTVRSMGRGTPHQVQFPNSVASLRPAGWARLGKRYIESTAKHRTGAAYFIDKNPNNFVYAGLIRRAMPNARIINARRHPLDSCLGSFKQLFASGQPFSYDMTEIGEYYLQYQRLMDHWHRVMPGFVLDVHYENVVADLDTEVRRILEFCGLPFEASCLRFHETERAVKTASSEQVRRPLYSTSVNLWRNYQAHLDTLVEILEPLLSGLPESQRPAKSLQAK